MKFENLTMRFGNKALFENETLDLQPGEILYVAGKNGAGKTTFLHILAGLLEPTSGSICRDKSTRYLAAESNHLLLQLSCIKNLILWASLAQVKVDPESVLTHWGLPFKGYLSTLPIHKFSTGMKRRLSLARLSIGSSELYLLDEPANGLDNQGVCLLREWTKTQQKSGKRLVLVSHDERLVEGLDCRRMDLVS